MVTKTRDDDEQKFVDMLLLFFAKYHASLLEQIINLDDAKRRFFMETIFNLFAISRAVSVAEVS